MEPNHRSKEITEEIMHMLGIPKYISGYDYLTDAIVKVSNDFDLLNCVAERLYSKIANKHNVTALQVEKAIRYTIGVAWNRSELATLRGLFGDAVEKRKIQPTNLEFIMAIVNRISCEINRFE